MKKLLLGALLLSFPTLAQDSSRVLTGSAQPPLPYNIIPQPGFENRTSGWSVTTGSFTTVNSPATDVARGQWSAKWTLPASAASGALLQTAAITIPAGLYAKTCRVSIRYKGNTATNGTMKIDAYDGTTVYGEATLANSTYYDLKIGAAFTCPTSGTLRFRIKTTATGPATPTPVYFDEAFIYTTSTTSDGAALTDLSNIASTSIPASLIPDGAVTLGSDGLEWSQLWTDYWYAGGLNKYITGAGPGWQLYDGSTEMFNFDFDDAAYINDHVGQRAVDLAARNLLDTGGETIALDWSSPGEVNIPGLLTRTISNSTLAGANQTLAAVTSAVVGIDGTITSIHGITAPSGTVEVILINRRASSITINNDTGTAANRIITGTGSDFTWNSDVAIKLIYDVTSSRWRLIGGP